MLKFDLFIKRQTAFLAALALVFCCLLLFLASNAGRTGAVSHPSAADNISADSFGCKDCNVVFIGMTNVRADHLGSYGYARPTTPNIDAFARRAVQFNSAFVSSSWTLPSYTSILTSLYPLQHGIMNRDDTNALSSVTRWSGISAQDAGVGAPPNATGWDPNASFKVGLNRSIVTLTDVLKLNGYVTGAFTGGFDFHPGYGVTSRFDEDMFWKPNATQAVSLSDYGSFKASVTGFSSWLSGNRDKKFFAYIQGFDAHCPFASPKENDAFVGNLTSNYSFDRCYWTFDRAKSITIGGKPYYYLFTEYNASLNKSNQPQVLFSQQDVDYMTALYDGEINLVDGYVGQVLGDLEREGVLNRTIVVVFSEHGDMFGKHGRFMRGGSLRGTFYDDVLHVPLIIYNPRFDEAGLQRDQLVESLDIAPTVLDMLSMGTPAQFAGKSLRPVLVNGSDVHDAVFAESKFLPTPGNLFFSNATFISAVRTKDWKMIREDVLDPAFASEKWTSVDSAALAANALESSVELYHVSEDPEELTDVSESNPGEMQNLTEMLFSRIRQTGG